MKGHDMKNHRKTWQAYLQPLACGAIVISALCTAGSAQVDGRRSDDVTASVVQTVASHTVQSKTTTGHWEAEQRRMQALFERPIEYEFTDTPLEEMMERLSSKHGFNYSIDNMALDTLGLDSSLPISHSMSGVCLRQALEMILGQQDLTYVIREGIVMVTSFEEAEEMLSTNIYPVRDLLHSNQLNESMDQLIGVITRTIERDSWEEVGGPGSIVAYQGVLTISQTHRTHAQIDRLLGQLRTAIDASGGPTIPLPQKEMPAQGRGGGGFGGGDRPN